MLFTSILVVFMAFIGRGYGEWALVWEDNFEGDSLDEDKWSYETGAEPNWGNHELQYYTEDQEKNVRVENGHLVIQARPEVKGKSQFTSGRLDTTESWTRGRFVISAKLPKGKHLWPAIWMMPKEDTYGDWPASGEIDIMELRGQHPDTVEATAHYGGAFPNNIFSGSPETKFSDFSTAFHEFALEWDENELRWYVDGKQYFKTNVHKDLWSHKGKDPYTKIGQPFDKPFYLILNVAVGGDFFPVDEYGPQVTPAEAKQWSKPTMEVDFVKVYQQK
ncbi:unnamed protein product [Medioppia subpectinata]|uniref:GH16 domain-containing protein n=1 Tax=Medioppia subpectinata TaxID=1979941 RepID=A0A7R9PYG0_9ACAR|nr:unnamed protein product [Medioppia subpectinata]CAG2105366.1 unnamed protein product [Medioppia subpectinata]